MRTIPRVSTELRLHGGAVTAQHAGSISAQKRVATFEGVLRAAINEPVHLLVPRRATNGSTGLVLHRLRLEEVDIDRADDLALETLAGIVDESSVLRDELMLTLTSERTDSTVVSQGADGALRAQYVLTERQLATLEGYLLTPYLSSKFHIPTLSGASGNIVYEPPMLEAVRSKLRKTLGIVRGAESLAEVCLWIQDAIVPLVVQRFITARGAPLETRAAFRGILNDLENQRTNTARVAMLVFDLNMDAKQHEFMALPQLDRFVHDDSDVSQAEKWRSFFMEVVGGLVVYYVKEIYDYIRNDSVAIDVAGTPETRLRSPYVSPSPPPLSLSPWTLSPSPRSPHALLDMSPHSPVLRVDTPPGTPLLVGTPPGTLRAVNRAQSEVVSRGYVARSTSDAEALDEVQAIDLRAPVERTMDGAGEEVTTLGFQFLTKSTTDGQRHFTVPLFVSAVYDTTPLHQLLSSILGAPARSIPWLVNKFRRIVVKYSDRTYEPDSETPVGYIPMTDENLSSYTKHVMAAVRSQYAQSHPTFASIATYTDTQTRLHSEQVMFIMELNEHGDSRELTSELVEALLRRNALTFVDLPPPSGSPASVSPTCIDPRSPVRASPYATPSTRGRKRRRIRGSYRVQRNGFIRRRL